MSKQVLIVPTATMRCFSLSDDPLFPKALRMSAEVSCIIPMASRDKGGYCLVGLGTINCESGDRFGTTLFPGTGEMNAG